VRTECYITRRAEFSASHRLHDPALDEEENRRLFRECNWEGGHGHNYLLEVTVAGPVDPRTGMVVNLKDLKAVIEERILGPCDHRNLDRDVPFLEGIITTTENLCIAFWEELEEGLSERIGEARLHRIRLRETRDNFCEYFGPGPAPDG